ncbi:hypothetical protein EDC01DRAFT_756552 [Geopyxis carbonaria]|nr:hypothetical protein EDC01DRAFT_756552 [Geopyxis carbonaria]
MTMSLNTSIVNSRIIGTGQLPIAVKEQQTLDALQTVRQIDVEQAVFVPSLVRQANAQRSYDNMLETLGQKVSNLLAEFDAAGIWVAHRFCTVCPEQNDLLFAAGEFVEKAFMAMFPEMPETLILSLPLMASFVVNDLVYLNRWGFKVTSNDDGTDLVVHIPEKKNENRDNSQKNLEYAWPREGLTRFWWGADTYGGLCFEGTPYLDEMFCMTNIVGSWELDGQNNQEAAAISGNELDHGNSNVETTEFVPTEENGVMIPLNGEGEQALQSTPLPDNFSEIYPELALPEAHGQGLEESAGLLNAGTHREESPQSHAGNVDEGTSQKQKVRLPVQQLSRCPFLSDREFPPKRSLTKEDCKYLRNILAQARFKPSEEDLEIPANDGTLGSRKQERSVFFAPLTLADFYEEGQENPVLPTDSGNVLPEANETPTILHDCGLEIGNANEYEHQQEGEAVDLCGFNEELDNSVEFQHQNAQENPEVSTQGINDTQNPEIRNEDSGVDLMELFQDVDLQGVDLDAAPEFNCENLDFLNVDMQVPDQHQAVASSHEDSSKPKCNCVERRMRAALTVEDSNVMPVTCDQPSVFEEAGIPSEGNEQELNLEGLSDPGYVSAETLFPEYWQQENPTESGQDMENVQELTSTNDQINPDHLNEQGNDQNMFQPLVPVENICHENENDMFSTQQQNLQVNSADGNLKPLGQISLNLGTAPIEINRKRRMPAWEPDYPPENKRARC